MCACSYVATRKEKRDRETEGSRYTGTTKWKQQTAPVVGNKAGGRIGDRQWCVVVEALLLMRFPARIRSEIEGGQKQPEAVVRSARMSDGVPGTAGGSCGGGGDCRWLESVELSYNSCLVHSKFLNFGFCLTDLNGKFYNLAIESEIA